MKLLPAFDKYAVASNIYEFISYDTKNNSVKLKRKDSGVLFYAYNAGKNDYAVDFNGLMRQKGTIRGFKSLNIAIRFGLLKLHQLLVNPDENDYISISELMWSSSNHYARKGRGTNKSGWQDKGLNGLMRMPWRGHILA